MNSLATALGDPIIKENVERILMTYSKLDRMNLIMRKDILHEDLAKIVDLKAAIALVNFLDLSGNSTTDLTDLIDDPKGKKLITELSVKFNPIFSGFYTTYPDDWFSLSYRTNFDVKNKTPSLHITLQKRSGEIMFLDSPLRTLISLVYSLVTEMDISLEGVKELREVPIMRSELGNAKSMIDRMLAKLDSLQNLE
jgi:hypothetical protein